MRWCLSTKEVGGRGSGAREKASVQNRPLTPDPWLPLLCFCPEVRVPLHLNPLNLRGHQQRLFGVEINGHELQAGILLPVLHAVLPYTRLWSMMQALWV